jgi:predicted nucleic acid-binding protein
VFERPESVAEAWQQASAWLDCPAAWIPLPTARHREALGPLLQGVAGQAHLVPDAHLAALAIEHGLTLCSTDGDFARFPGLRWENPLA